MAAVKERVVPELVERPRRLRGSAPLRSLVAETDLRARHLIAPFFVVPGEGQVQPVAALPGVSRYSVDLLLGELERVADLGVKAVLLFGVVPQSDKDARGTRADDPAGPVSEALRRARSHFGNDLVFITDVCLCGYTDHGHCGLVGRTSHGVVIDNDASLERLAEMARAHGEAGADLVAPSDMMDGRVAAIRRDLDQRGFTEVGIVSYAVKYASAFYGPFREAAGSSPKEGASGKGELDALRDRKTYQMDPSNAREALRELRLDQDEGADIVMVKPALPYLDVIGRARGACDLPLAAYHVSGEYAMIKAAAAAGGLDEAAAARETLLSIRRAGADLIVTYYAAEALEKGWLDS